MTRARLEDICKRFGDVRAVDDFNLNIEGDEFITLVGPSGCGKTTTLRMVSGLETPSSGEITIDGRDVTGLPPQERNVALLFQEIALYPHMTVQENMAYGLKINGVPEEERNERVREAAERLQIDDLLPNMPNELSGGQQQRVALGRSIVRDPSIFLFDEPMSDLDAKLKQTLRPLFQEITTEVGCPALYVTHDQEEAMTMSDRVVVMNDGRIDQIGTPADVYDQPQSEFVAGFIGQPPMQFFDGVLHETDETMWARIGDFEFDLPDGKDLSGYGNEEVKLGVRPEDIDVRDGSSDGIPAQHILDEPRGNLTNSIFDTEVGRVTVLTEPDFRGENNEYSLAISGKKLKIFSKESGVRLY